MSEQNIVVYTYTPHEEGDHLTGVPARDLTVLDVANLSRSQLRNMLSPGPSGGPMYTASDDENDHAAQARKLQAGYLKTAEAVAEPAGPALRAMTRDDLNARAAEVGVADAETLPNKDAVIEAIEAHEPES